MRTVGIREIRQQASKYLRQVERGATIEITDRGRPVARLVPIERGNVVDDLIATGRLAPGKGDLLGLGPPLPASPGKTSLSRLLAASREDER